MGRCHFFFGKKNILSSLWPNEKKTCSSLSPIIATQKILIPSPHKIMTLASPISWHFNHSLLKLLSRQRKAGKLSVTIWTAPVDCLGLFFTWERLDKSSWLSAIQNFLLNTHFIAHITHIVFPYKTIKVKTSSHRECLLVSDQALLKAFYCPLCSSVHYEE